MNLGDYSAASTTSTAAATRPAAAAGASAATAAGWNPVRAKQSGLRRSQPFRSRIVVPLTFVAIIAAANRRCGDDSHAQQAESSHCG